MDAEELLFKAELEAETDWVQPKTDGVYVSEDGKYCCFDCRCVLVPEGKQQLNEDDYQRTYWSCPDCDSMYPLH